jgi:signal peptidase I
MSFVERALDFFTARRVTIEGESMLPGLRQGDRVVFSTRAYRTSPPQRGDIVLMRTVGDPGRNDVKRVVGIPGETVNVRGGRVWVGGLPLAEPYLLRRGLEGGGLPGPGEGGEPKGPGERQVWPVWTLGAEEYFVMGDNRDRQDVLDSRRYGPVSRDRIVARMGRRF